VSDNSLARSFDRAAEHYQRGRPGWPSEVLDVVDLAADATVLDLGSGTGKLTRLLVGRFERVIAVEPLDGMRALLQSVVPEAEALAGSAEEIPLPDESVDAVFCADAFHWFDGERALAEIARVLRPGGALVLMGNIQSGPSEPSIAAAADIVNTRGRPERQINRYTSGEWREPFASAPFEELREAQFEHEQTLDPDGMVAHFLSMSWIASLPDDEKERLVRDVKPLLDAPEYRRPFRTEVHWTRRR
jgi:ubiquinone/menaquinone biosynthesis C-methylase UbiE